MKTPFTNFKFQGMLPYDDKMGAYRLRDDENNELCKHPRFLQFLKEFFLEVEQFDGLSPKKFLELLELGKVNTALAKWVDYGEFIQAVKWLFEK